MARKNKGKKQNDSKTDNVVVENDNIEEGTEETNQNEDKEVVDDKTMTSPNETTMNTTAIPEESKIDEDVDKLKDVEVKREDELEEKNDNETENKEEIKENEKETEDENLGEVVNDNKGEDHDVVKETAKEVNYYAHDNDTHEAPKEDFVEKENVEETTKVNLDENENKENVTNVNETEDVKEEVIENNEKEPEIEHINENVVENKPVETETLEELANNKAEETIEPEIKAEEANHKQEEQNVEANTETHNNIEETIKHDDLPKQEQITPETKQEEQNTHHIVEETQNENTQPIKVETIPEIKQVVEEITHHAHQPTTDLKIEEAAHKIVENTEFTPKFNTTEITHEHATPVVAAVNQDITINTAPIENKVSVKIEETAKEICIPSTEVKHPIVEETKTNPSQETKEIESKDHHHNTNIVQPVNEEEELVEDVIGPESDNIDTDQVKVCANIKPEDKSTTVFVPETKLNHPTETEKNKEAVNKSETSHEINEKPRDPNNTLQRYDNVDNQYSDDKNVKINKSSKNSKLEQINIVDKINIDNEDDRIKAVRKQNESKVVEEKERGACSKCSIF